MSKLNLLELCLSPALGGLELYMMNAAKALDSEFNTISVISNNSQLKQYYEDTKYRYEQIKQNKRFSFSAAKKLSKIIDKYNIDIIHLHWTNDLFTAVVSKLLSKRNPKIVQTRNMNMTRFKNDMYHRFLYKQMSLILPVTKLVGQQIKKYVPESVCPKVEVLYMGANQLEVLSKEEIEAYKTEIGVAPDELLVGMVGRIEEAKGQYLLIEALEILKKEGLKIKVCFVGHATHESYQKELEETVKSKGLDKEISFLGFTKKTHRFMQSCDMTILATTCETFGLVIIEAMQVGTAVIATNQCGPLEIIEDGKTGLLFEKNSSDDLARKIKQLEQDRQLCSTISENGKKSAKERFSSSKQFKKLEIILKELI